MTATSTMHTTPRAVSTDELLDMVVEVGRALACSSGKMDIKPAGKEVCILC